MSKKDKSERMCKLASKGKLEAAGKAAKNAKYICGKCFRAAKDDGHLCKPEKI